MIFVLDNPAKRLDPFINRIIDDVMFDMHEGYFNEVIIAGGFSNSYYNPDLLDVKRDEDDIGRFVVNESGVRS